MTYLLDIASLWGSVIVLGAIGWWGEVVPWAFGVVAEWAGY